ncbi:hypothetical protein ACIRS1_34680 [Kitasatospora sp. NPDC101176]|uniref:hypothetical protein n=1 Tax=Kitasatospora sp. NPDC101176 TaxID=3364099 RepID=UPI0037FDFD80
MTSQSEHPARPDLAAMLTDQTTACAPAREALLAGGRLRFSSRVAPDWTVRGIAATRLGWARKVGLVTLGLDESVEILSRHRDVSFLTGLLDAPDRSWFFTLYFDATGTGLLACSAVKNQPSTRKSVRRFVESSGSLAGAHDQTKAAPGSGELTDERPRSLHRSSSGREEHA